MSKAKVGFCCREGSGSQKRGTFRREGVSRRGGALRVEGGSRKEGVSRKRGGYTRVLVTVAWLLRFATMILSPVNKGVLRARMGSRTVQISRAGLVLRARLCLRVVLISRARLIGKVGGDLQAGTCIGREDLELGQEMVGV